MKVDPEKKLNDAIPFEIHSGLGLLKFDSVLDEIKLIKNGMHLFNLGFAYGTIETILEHLGWEKEPSREFSAKLNEAVMDLDRIDSGLIELWMPVLSILDSGSYSAYLHLIPIIKPSYQDSFFFKRYQFRKVSHGIEIENQSEWESYFAQPIYQGPGFYNREDGLLSSIILPVQDPSKLNPERVNYYVDQIQSGLHPAVVCLEWHDSKIPWAEYLEEILFFCVIDGHHKLEAYAKCNLPAKILGLIKVDNNMHSNLRPKYLSRLSEEQQK